MACSQDMVCPNNGAVVLDEYNFRNLFENLENTEAYIKQLQTILDKLLYKGK